MKYYSEKLDEIFDTEQQLFEAEKRAETKAKTLSEAKEEIWKEITKMDNRIDRLERVLMIYEKKTQEAFNRRAQLKRQFDELEKRGKYTSRGSSLIDMDVFQLFN